MMRDESLDATKNNDNLPAIAINDDFHIVIQKLSEYFQSVIELPSSFDQLRTTTAGACLHDLVEHLGANCQNPAIVNALLALKWHYDADSHGQLLNETRSSACEIVAWRLLASLPDSDAVRLCLYDIPDPCAKRPQEHHNRNVADPEEALGESSPLLLLQHRSTLHDPNDDDDDKTVAAPLLGDADPTLTFRSLNALEIAVVAGAKRFLGRSVVQRILTGIWHGHVIFWDSLSPHATKAPRFYDPDTTDIYSRLRVPKYLKTWEVAFFLVFLALFYAVLIQRVAESITVTEGFLWLWIAAFCYDEFSEWLDAGYLFYVTDIWNLCDLVVMLLGLVFAVLRIYGVTHENPYIGNLAFDILALEALFLVPRTCSLLSLSPSWGILIPCLKEMTIDFAKFMVIILIIYCGFLTTFSLLGRDHFSLVRMAGILGKIFFGSSYVGFEVMGEIDPVFGPPLMILFIALSAFLLMGSLAGLLANSFARVMSEAHDEYAYVYSVYVLEASTSNRLTHFYPPFNLLALLVFRPWRLLFRGDEAFRRGRIWLLKVTHTPIVAGIRLYELVTRTERVTELGPPFRPRSNPSAGYTTGLAAAAAAAPPPPPPQVDWGGGSEGGSIRGRKQAKSGRLARPWSKMAAAENSWPAKGSAAVEEQIEELKMKIDRLTEVVTAMHEERELAGR